MTAPTWSNERRKLSALIPWPRNPRKIEGESVRRLQESFEEFGQPEVIAISPTNEVYNGHQRLKSWFAKFGDIEVDVRVSDRALTEKERERLTVLLHRGAVGEWDFETLANEFDVGELLEWGFTEMELGLDGAAPTNDAVPQVDRATELNEKWQVKPGDLWRVGEHRLICGDCTDAAVVARVMGGERAGMVFTDPPYATFGSSTGKMDIADFGMLKPFWEIMSRQIGDNVADGRGVFICCDWRSFPSLFEVASSKMRPANLIVWYHGAIKLGSNFRPSYELIFYLINRPFKTTWKQHGDTWHIENRSISDVWQIPQDEAAPGANRQHASQKPVALPSFALTHCSDPGDLVIDLFAGSGTTMVACENLGRRCRAVEIAPGYVAVILERMATAFPGIGIERVGNDATVAGEK